MIHHAMEKGVASGSTEITEPKSAQACMPMWLTFVV
jgi:hypothetical protein